ncbi:hypothetical protein K420107F6_00420 [Lactonifactor longoviformis]
MCIFNKSVFSIVIYGHIKLIILYNHYKSKEKKLTKLTPRNIITVSSENVLIKEWGNTIWIKEMKIKVLQ